MANQEVSEIITRLTVAKTVDAGRAVGDPHILPPTLRTDVDGDLAILLARETDTAPAEGVRAGASGARRVALDELERQHRGGYRVIKGIDEDEITEAQRLQVFESYGWAGGEIGVFTDARIMEMARLAPTVSAAEVGGDATRLYSAPRLARIAAQLAIVDGLESPASGADREQATRRRDTALDLARTTLLRVRFHYCSATRDADQNPELVRIGFQPRREPGTVGDGGGTPLEVPAKTVLSAFDVGQDGNPHVSNMTAARAVTFEVQEKPVADADFVTLTTTAPGPDFHFPALAAGDHLTRVRGINASGPGEWSDETPFTVA